MLLFFLSSFFLLLAIVLNRNESDNLMSDQWVWDKECAPSEVKLSSNLEAAYFHVDPVDESTGTVGES